MTLLMAEIISYNFYTVIFLPTPYKTGFNGLCGNVRPYICNLHNTGPDSASTPQLQADQSHPRAPEGAPLVS